MSDAFDFVLYLHLLLLLLRVSYGPGLHLNKAVRYLIPFDCGDVKYLFGLFDQLQSAKLRVHVFDCQDSVLEGQLRMHPRDGNVLLGLDLAVVGSADFHGAQAAETNNEGCLGGIGISLEQVQLHIRGLDGGVVVQHAVHPPLVGDDRLVDFAAELAADLFRGYLRDVLGRDYLAGLGDPVPQAPQMNVPHGAAALAGRQQRVVGALGGGVADLAGVFGFNFASINLSLTLILFGSLRGDHVDNFEPEPAQLDDIVDL